MRKMYIEAHNMLGRIITKAISKGHMGEYLIQADVGSSTKCRNNHAPDIGLNHVPPNLLAPPTGVGAVPPQKQSYYI